MEEAQQATVESLLQEHDAYLQGIARKCARKYGADADDVAQELRILVTTKYIEGAFKAPDWRYKVWSYRGLAMRRAVAGDVLRGGHGHAREGVSRVSVSDPDHHAVISDEDGTSVRGEAQMEARAALALIFRRVDEKQAMAVVCRGLCLSKAEIREQAGVSHVTIGKRLKKLREELNNDA